MAEIHEQRVNENKLDTVLAEDITFEGEASFTKELMIKGRYTGKIRASGNLYIAPEADVEADIVADSVFVRGRVKGSIKASSRVELQGNAEVVGDITAPKIVMDTGCRFDGISRMKSPEGGTL
ncbi:MAG: polymer-forming cytoskeletal protein [Spirochaetaceae bacterium]|nr:polymer-forming cytoskeletal protein [Spirochaetaceae bacterium]